MMMSPFRLNLGTLKEPLGFIKTLEWLTAIFAFWSCGSYSGQSVVSLFCGGTRNETLNITFQYPFRLNEVVLVAANTSLCSHIIPETHLIGDAVFSSQSYVAVAILAFFYTMGALLVYCGYMDIYRQPTSSWPQTDFVLTALFTALWLICASAWAKGLQNIRDATSTAGITATLSVCQEQNVVCEVTEVANIRPLRVAVVFGFLNLILWLGNVWFTYKETHWHSKSFSAEESPVGRQVPVPI
ncbi:synaptophysin-like protein 1 [Denticeps clupeoides]|uniref:MARVEL domain-containing protein n=1 Tax=Denticeps clupeoides TaxID=299321 RepID=A0AAY4CXJ1_9TELE|nr:synaptophysin-like protein 1 [Denticeps clupeoides]